MTRHLAQLNIATLRYPLDDPRSADFVDNLAVVNGAGEQTLGYVWRLQSDSGDATDIRVYDDPLVIVNLTVWESPDALKAFAYRGVHREFFRRRDEWFVEGASRTALWWVRGGALPTTDDAKRRLDFIAVYGSSPYAFVMGQNHPALVVDHVGPDDGRAQELLDQLPDNAWAGDHEHLVVVDLDDQPVACGGYRRLDEGTAEIKHMYVAQAARGVRIGAAIIAELEAAASAKGVQRLMLETWPRQALALEQFGYRSAPCRDDTGGSPRSIVVEKTLTA